MRGALYRAGVRIKDAGETLGRRAGCGALASLMIMIGLALRDRAMSMAG